MIIKFSQTERTRLFLKNITNQRKMHIQFGFWELMMSVLLHKIFIHTIIGTGLPIRGVRNGENYDGKKTRPRYQHYNNNG